MRIAYTHAHACGPLLFAGEFMARALTLYDHWLISLGPIASTDGPDDGTASILRSVAMRHPSRVRITEAHRWPDTLSAVRCALSDARSELSGGFLWHLPPGEVWEAAAIGRAERALAASSDGCAAFASIVHLSDEVTLSGEWLGAPSVRLWNWRGELPIQAMPLRMASQGPAQLLPQLFRRHDLYRSRNIEAHEAAYPGITRRWIELLAADPSTFPRPASDLLGPNGRIFTKTQIHYHDIQTDPTP